MAAVVVAAVSLVCGHASAGTVDLAPGGYTRPDPRIKPLSPRAATVYRQTRDLMRDPGPDIGRQMLDLLLPVVRTDRDRLLMGRLVVAAARVAGGTDGKKRVDELMKAADASAASNSPQKGLDAFLAGVAVHYRGHTRGTSRAAKTADYQLALKYLHDAQAEFGSTPRLWIYLAISYVRTGQQQQAQAAITRAAQTEVGEDADVWYCRAEVFQRTNPKQALADIDRYIAVMAENHAKGAFSAPDKERKVRAMREHMQRVVAGTATPMGHDLFDPLVIEPLWSDALDAWILAFLLVTAPSGLVWLWRRRATAAARTGSRAGDGTS